MGVIAVGVVAPLLRRHLPQIPNVLSDSAVLLVSTLLLLLFFSGVVCVDLGGKSDGVGGGFDDVELIGVKGAKSSAVGGVAGVSGVLGTERLKVLVENTSFPVPLVVSGEESCFSCAPSSDGVETADGRDG